MASNLSLPRTPLSPSHRDFLLQVTPPPTNQVLAEAAATLSIVESIQSVKPNWAPFEEETLEGEIVEETISEVCAANNDLEEDIIMASFDVANGTDGDKAISQIQSIQVPFTREDIDFWFCELETQLTIIDVRSQWLKRIALQRVLPPEIRQEVKALLILDKEAAGTDIYKRIKTELLDLFGQKPEDSYLRAKNRVMDGKPSQLGKKILDDICKKASKLDDCCCANTVWAMFREELPTVIRNHISDMTFNKDTYREIFAKADQIWASNKGADPAPVKVAAISGDSNNASVAAVSVGRGKNRRQPRNSQGGAQNNSQRNQGAGGGTSSKASPAPGNSNQKENKGPRHETAKGDKLCKMHHRWGVNATYCAGPWMCQMKDIYKAPQ